MQKSGFDTVDANKNLGLDEDARGFDIAAEILKKLSLKRMKLLSNNPRKAEDLRKNGIDVVKMVSHQFLSEHVEKYYNTKAKRMKHKLDV